MVAQDGLNFAEFDAKAANLDLMIRSPDKFEGAIQSEPTDVPGAVDTFMPLLCRRQESSLGEFWLAPVPQRHIGTADRNLPNDCGRCPGAIEQENLRILNWETHWHRMARDLGVLIDEILQGHG